MSSLHHDIAPTHYFQNYVSTRTYSEFASNYERLQAELRREEGRLIVFAVKEGLANACHRHAQEEAQDLLRPKPNDRTILIVISDKLDGKQSFLPPYSVTDRPHAEPIITPFPHTATIRSDGLQFCNLGQTEPTTSPNFSWALDAILSKHVTPPLQVLCCGDPPPLLYTWLDNAFCSQTILTITDPLPILRSTAEVVQWIDTIHENDAAIVFISDEFTRPLALDKPLPPAYRVTLINPINPSPHTYWKEQTPGPGTVVKWGRDGKSITIGDQSYKLSTAPFTLDYVLDKILGLAKPIVVYWGTPPAQDKQSWPNVQRWLEERQGPTAIFQGECEGLI